MRIVRPILKSNFRPLLYQFFFFFTIFSIIFCTTLSVAFSNSCVQRLWKVAHSEVQFKVISYLFVPNLTKNRIRILLKSLCSYLVHTIIYITPPPLPLASCNPPKTTCIRSKYLLKRRIIYVREFHHIVNSVGTCPLTKTFSSGAVINPPRILHQDFPY